MFFKRLTLMAATAFLLCTAGTALAGGDRTADLSLIYGSTGVRGKVSWGDAGLKLDFSYPVSPGQSAAATLIIRAEDGQAALLLHKTREIVRGEWAVAEHPSPLDLLEPALGDARMESVGQVMVGQLLCDVKEGGRGRSLRVWYPTAFPDIPRMARLVGDGASSELNLAKVRPTTLHAEDLAVPEGYTPLDFDLTDLMIRATDSEDAATLGARVVVWFATSNLERQLVTVETDIFLEGDVVVEAESPDGVAGWDAP